MDLAGGRMNRYTVDYRVSNMHHSLLVKDVHFLIKPIVALKIWRARLWREPVNTGFSSLLSNM
jgi:hypothetical protein